MSVAVPAPHFIKPPEGTVMVSEIQEATALRASIFALPNRFRGATVTAVIDGDTVRLVVEQPEHETTWRPKCRLAGMNAPELTKEGGAAAKDHLENLVRTLGGANSFVEILGRDKYGRVLVVLWGWDEKAAEPVNLNQRMVDNGFATLMK